MRLYDVRFLALLVSALAGPVSAAYAQDLAQTDPTRLANAQGGGTDWQVRVGAGFLYGPAFLGSDDYQLRAGPDFQVRYKDRFFVSLTDGAGFDWIKTDQVRAGPIIKYQQQRRESGKSSFVISGDRTHALRGLGDVDAAAEVGGYIAYQSGLVSARAEVRRGFGGHEGVVADLSAGLTSPSNALTIHGRSIVMSAGPRATIVDSDYNQAYFGVNAVQSARSGLRQYAAKGGLLSYGVGGAIVVPVSDRISAALIGGYDRVAGDAGDSPLVRERGSRNQGTVGLGLTYHFGA